MIGKIRYFYGNFVCLCVGVWGYIMLGRSYYLYMLLFVEWVFYVLDFGLVSFLLCIFFRFFVFSVSFMWFWYKRKVIENFLSFFWFMD